MISGDFQPFWQASALTTTQLDLLNAVLEAHEQSAFRNNISSVTVLNAYAGSSSYGCAIASALLTLGGPHAPLAETFDLLNDPAPMLTAETMLGLGMKIPGWGSSFHKGKPDPAWAIVDKLLKSETRERIESITWALHGNDKKVYPNPSCYTAAAALELGIPRAMCAYLLILGRLNAWSRIMLTNRI